MGLRPTERNEERAQNGEWLAKFGSFFRGAVVPLSRDRVLLSRDRVLLSRDREGADILLRRPAR
jgi:hypothetical protein